MRIIFAGTPEFAARHLEIILESEHEIVCALTQPDRKSGRGKKLRSSPVRQLAEKEKIQLLQPKSLNSIEVIKDLETFKPDLMLVVAYGLLIPKNILDVPSLGCINVHASILPRWRGASPMEYSILNGDKKVGVSYMQMSEGLDEGPIYEIHDCDLNPKDKLEDVEEMLIDLSKTNLNKFLDKISNKEINHTKQDQAKVTIAPKIDKSILRLDWQKDSSIEVVRKINAFGAKYGTYTFLGEKRIKLHQAKDYKAEESFPPGTIKLYEDEMVIFCGGNSSILVEKIQMEGKNKVSGKDFVFGYLELINKYKYFSSPNQ